MNFLDGFHPIVSHPEEEPKQTQAVKQATLRHFALYNQIAENNAYVGLRYEKNIIRWNDVKVYTNLFSLFQGNVIVPSDTEAVENAKQRHFNLYGQIAAEHARLGAELEAKRALFESTSEKDISFDHLQHH